LLCEDIEKNGSKALEFAYLAHNLAEKYEISTYSKPMIYHGLSYLVYIWYKPLSECILLEKKGLNWATSITRVFY
jgi:hypothetical protein